MSRDIRVHHGVFGRVALLELSTSLVEHAHPSMHLKFWAGGASRRLQVADDWLAFDRQNGVAINSWVPHATPLPGPTQPTTFLVYYLEPGWVQTLCTHLGLPPTFSTTSVPIDAGLSYLVTTLVSRLAQSEQVPQLFVELMTSRILEKSLTSMGQPVRSSDSAEPTRPIDRRIRRSIDFMQANKSTRITFEDVAQASGLSRPHFFSLFRQSLKITPGVYWNTLRVESAIDSLVNTEVSLGELSFDMGFSEPANFSRFFRQHTGVCPSKYRHGLSQPPEQD